MDWAFIVFLVVAVPIVLTIWLIVRAVSAKERIEELSRRLGALEADVHRLKAEAPSTVRPAPAPTRAAETPTPVVKPPTAEVIRTPIVPPISAPPPLPREFKPGAIVPNEAAKSPTSPPLPPVPKPAPAVPAVNFEQFMGVKLFAWVGGLALFLGVAFFVKYSFENNFVPPELRVALGFLAGVGLMVGGIIMARKDYPALSQTLCATGVVILYAVTFACRSIYHFEFFGPLPTFLLMVLITATAFLLAVRMNAVVVAILGMLGGFLTPILLSSGVDNPLGLFGYIAVLDLGLLFVALNRRWFYLVALAAVGTALMQIGWADKFFTSEKYFEGDKIFVAFAVLLGFNLLYLIGAAWAQRRAQTNFWFSGAHLGLATVAFGFAAWFLGFETLAQRPWLLFGFVLLIDLGVAALVLFDQKISAAQPLAGLVSFGLLAGWTANSLTNSLLNPALAFYFSFAVLHAAFPVWRQRRAGGTSMLWASKVFAPLALGLVLIPIFKLPELSFLVWPFVLLIDVLAIGLAVLTASLLPVLAVMLLTLAATGALILKIPAELTGLSTSFVLIAFFAVFFVAISVWLVRKLLPKAAAHGLSLETDFADPAALAALLPAFSAALPFLLLIMVTLRLPLTNPTPVFGLALLLVVLLLGLTKMFSFDWLPAVALVCVAALECAWHFHRFLPAAATIPLTWYVIFFAVFTIFPFLFRAQFANKTIPWAVAALVGLPQFFLLYRLIGATWPNGFMGVLPAAFVLPALASLVLVLKCIPATSPARLSQLAFYGGVALFFITLIFPIQFDNQWLTLGWALEGAALLWLFHRVPHPGLPVAGVALLLAAFTRLALNPAVLDYHVRGASPILNWYLYAYGVTIACLFSGARLLAPPRNLVLKSNLPPVLVGLGIVLTFLLMNIQIADFFTPVGARVRFEFGGNFAREMTYTIAWALFALALIVIGIVKNIAALRYTALALLSVTLLKLFFHDLAELHQLYRIGAFIGVAVIAMLASFAYQRFYSALAKAKIAKNETPN